MKIAYILNTYPQPSHSFIRRELAAIEAAQGPVLRLAMRRAEGALVDPQDLAEAERTQYLLQVGAVGLVLSLLATLLRMPRGVLRAAIAAVRLARASEVGYLRHVVYLAEACVALHRLRRANIGHVHAHFGTNAAAVAHLVRALGGPPYSFTVHGPEEFDAPRALSLGPKMAAAAFTVAVSAYGRSQLCRWVAPEHWSRLHVVHCGIQADRFAQAQPLPEGPVRLVSIGRFAEQKGQLVLIDAMAQLRAAGLAVTLRLVGDGPMRPELEEAIQWAGLQDSVTLTGWQDEAGVRAEIDAATALVMPSFAEGLPMVIMEAMAAGRPVISTFVAGIPELVLPGKTGWLVPAGDADALTRAIEALSETPIQHLQKMSETARVRALARHDSQREAGKLLSLIAAHDP